ncbi:hypothetical protein ACFFU9_01640 [Mariniflexile ostreae]|uniref:Uncharacterized protein n=1 Tax=Mariniflexile ostreae TaxID=1520892 RepID=A0ABV5F7L1_9FLAO
MKQDYITIKEVNLNNNCPECYNNNGLHVTFLQKFVETRFYKSITSDLSHKMECRTCNSMIYPERWTEDIERVFDYHKKASTPKAPTYKLKKNAWAVIASLAFIVITALIIVLF